MSSSPVSSNTRRVTDIETLVNLIVQRLPGLKYGVTEYRQVPSDSNDMLRWAAGSRKYADFQMLPHYGLGRLGTVGDGNCLIHALLTVLSPTYRAHNGGSRSKIADAFRKVLRAREAELRDLADVTYFEIGGASALEESFEILRGHREEINIELAPLIGRLFDVNLLAVQINEDMTLRPACATWKGFDPSRPTVIVNYLGGGMNFGNANFVEGGHYESLFAPVVVTAAASSSEGAGAGAGAGAKSKRRTTRRKPVDPIVSLDEVATQYVFLPGAAELAPILSMFSTTCREEMSVEASTLAAEIAARETAAASTLKRISSSSAKSNSSRRSTRRKRSRS